MKPIAKLCIPLSIIVFATGLLSAAGEQSSRPNILFIFVDDLGWGDLGVNFQNDKPGKKHATPELDRMAREGVRMLRHYCPAPVCAPSRSSLLSGLHQGHANVRDNQFDKALADNHTLATVLNAAGYRTVLVGKYGLQGNTNKGKSDPSQWPAYPTKRGFDEFFGYVRHGDGHQHYPANAWPLGNNEKHRSPQELWHNDDEISAKLDKCYTTDLFTAFAKHWITRHRKASPEQPFFMVLAHDTPHGALQVPTTPYPKEHGLEGGLQWLGKDGNMINTARGEIDSYIHPDYQRSNWTEVEQRFATSVRRIDSTVGDVLQLLRDLEIADNTLVVFTSDNGPHSESYITDQEYRPTSFRSYGPMDGMKRDVWEGGIRMPTIAWWPEAIEAGREDNQPSQFHDWMATFATMAGMPIPALSDGVSLLPQLTGEGSPTDSTVYIEYSQGGKTPNYADYAANRQGQRRGQMQVLFLDGYKGVRTNLKNPHADFEIYEVNEDPSERKNLAGTSKAFETLNQNLKDRVLQIRRADPQAERPYDGLAVPALLTNTDTQPGVLWQIYEGDFPWVPRLAHRQPTRTMASTSIETELPTRATSVFQGFLKISKEGDYQFRLKTNGKAVVKLHQAILIDADHGYEGEERHTKLKLKAGYHPLTIWCTAQETEPALSLQWTAEGEKSPIPASALFHSLNN